MFMTLDKAPLAPADIMRSAVLPSMSHSGADDESAHVLAFRDCHRWISRFG